MIFRKYKYRSQINEKDCGVAALGMILDNYRRWPYPSLSVWQEDRWGGLFYRDETSEKLK